MSVKVYLEKYQQFRAFLYLATFQYLVAYFCSILLKLSLKWGQLGRRDDHFLRRIHCLD